MAKIISMFALATGPMNKASGAVSKPRNGASVFWARSTPCGTRMASENSGLSPCANAWGTQARNHIASTESEVPPNSRSDVQGSTGQNAASPMTR